LTTSVNDSTSHLFVGVDSAATSATVSWLVPGATPWRAIPLEQTPQAFRTLQQRLLWLGHAAETILVAMEATGSYWISLATTLVRAGFAVRVINPAQAHHVARALLKGAKTDAIDAQTLAQLASLLPPTVWTPPPAV
jgi:transposase